MNADVNTSAAIAYSKLALTGSIVNADVNASAAIAYSKLALTGAVLNADLAGSIAYSKLALTGSLVNADINASAAISYSKLALTGAILNADLAGSIAYSKLSLTGAILNADLAGSIAYSKLSLTGAILNADLAGSIAYSKLSLTGAILNADLAGSIAASKLVGSDIATVGTITSGTWSATTIEVNKGGTGVTSVTTAPTASSFAGWDANSNLSAANVIDGYATTATAAATTTLTVASKGQQFFTGSTTQTCALPDVSALVTGQQFLITNLSSGVVTVQSSGGDTLQAMAANTQLLITCISTSGTGTSSWSWAYAAVQNSLSGGGTITALTGDVTASGSGSVAATLAATQANVVTLSKSTGVALHGTNTNDSAAAGYLGEYVESLQTSYANCGSSTTTTNATSISLTAGDWDVSALFDFTLNGAVMTNGVYGGINTTSATLGTLGVNTINAYNPSATINSYVSIPPYRVSVGSTTTVYGVIRADFSSGGPPQFKCRLSARRVR